MKFIIKSVATAAIVFGAFGSNAAMAASADAQAKVKIVAPVTLVNKIALDFGTVVSGTAASTVAVDAASARTCGTGLTCAGTPTASSFEVGGTSGEIVVITVPSTAVTLTSGANTMTVTGFTAVSPITLGATVTTFRVGGTLNVGANQAQGAYTGTFSVSANYQ